MKSISKLALAACILFASCSRKDDPQPVVVNPPPTPVATFGKVFMEFSATAGDNALVMNDKWYQNAAGDSFKVSRFNYYVSNVVFNGASGTPNYAETESYHLIETPATAGEVTFNVANVPAGKYTSVTYMIGVDSARNVSGAQTGALDKANGNFWSWNNGYIMLKFEGNSPQSTNADGRLIYHCGGFSGDNSVLKMVTLPFTEAIEVTETATPHVHIAADLMKMFSAPNMIRFADVASIHMPGKAAKALSDNYANMFKVTYAGR